MILNKLIKSSGKCDPKSKTFLSLFIPGTVKAESNNTSYKYEYEYTFFVLYNKTQRLL